jgi:hypothetical protein
MNKRKRNATEKCQDRTIYTVTCLLLAALLATGCSTIVGTADRPTPTAEPAVQLSEEAQAYIELSRVALREHLGIDADQIELDSITEPATADDVYVVKLTANGHTYEFYGRSLEVTLVSSSVP